MSKLITWASVGGGAVALYMWFATVAGTIGGSLTGSGQNIVDQFAQANKTFGRTVNPQQSSQNQAAGLPTMDKNGDVTSYKNPSTPNGGSQQIILRAYNPNGVTGATP